MPFWSLWMAPQSDHAVGPSEIAKLLELLNASEGREETASHASQAPDELEVPISTQPVSSDPVALPGDPFEEVENRFAAHIVQGMSKLKRG
jgi:hypothetical protein